MAPFGNVQHTVAMNDEFTKKIMARLASASSATTGIFVNNPSQSRTSFYGSKIETSFPSSSSSAQHENGSSKISDGWIFAISMVIAIIIMTAACTCLEKMKRMADRNDGTEDYDINAESGTRGGDQLPEYPRHDRDDERDWVSTYWILGHQAFQYPFPDPRQQSAIRDEVRSLYRQDSIDQARRRPRNRARARAIERLRQSLPDISNIPTRRRDYGSIRTTIRSMTPPPQYARYAEIEDIAIQDETSINWVTPSQQLDNLTPPPSYQQHPWVSGL